MDSLVRALAPWFVAAALASGCGAAGGGTSPGDAADEGGGDLPEVPGGVAPDDGGTPGGAAPSDDDSAGDDAPGGPSIAFAAPADGSVVAGLIEVRVTAPEGVERVRLATSGRDLGEVETASGEAVLRWDSGALPDGEALLEASDPDSGAAAEVRVGIDNDDIVVYEAGTVENTETGTTALRLTHEGGLLSLTYTVVGSSDTAYYLPVTRDPTGADLVTADGDPWDDPVRAFPSRSPATAMVPNAPTVSLSEGEWLVWPANDGTPGEATLRVVVKRSWEEPRAGLLDLALHFVDGARLTAEDALSDSEFGAYLDTVQDVLLQADIGFGATSAQALPVDGAAEVSDYDEVDRILAATPDGGRVLNLVFVDRFVDDMDGVAGVTGGLPGPALLHGHRSSGVLVALDERWPWDHLAAVTAHEVGHYLGLFHTSDEDGEHPDALADTPECTTDPCSGDAVDNLMYPTVSGSTRLTGDQRWVMLRHPLVRLVDPSDLPAPGGGAARAASPLPSRGTPAVCPLDPARAFASPPAGP